MQRTRRVESCYHYYGLKITRGKESITWTLCRLWFNSKPIHHLSFIYRIPNIVQIHIVYIYWIYILCDVYVQYTTHRVPLSQRLWFEAHTIFINISICSNFNCNIPTLLWNTLEFECYLIRNERRPNFFVDIHSKLGTHFHTNKRVDI